MSYFTKFFTSVLQWFGLPIYLVKTLKLVQDTIGLSSTSRLFLESLDFVAFIDYCMDPWRQKAFLIICENSRNPTVRQFEGNEIWYRTEIIQIETSTGHSSTNLTWLVGCVGRWSNEWVLLPLMESTLDWLSSSSLTDNIGHICTIKKNPKNLQLVFFKSGHPLFGGRSLSKPYNCLLPDCFLFHEHD